MYKKQMGTFLILGSALLSTVDARPFPDRLGICYGFRGDQMFLHSPCIIGTGYGAGAQYMTLTVEKTVFAIEYPNLRPNQPPTLNGKPAISYKRDASFYQVLKDKPIDGETYIDCTRTKDGKIDICVLDPDRS
jgi:hypothetical protein